MEGTNSLKPFHLALTIFITQTGTGIIMIPSALAEEVGHDGWISVLITGLAIMILSMLIILLLSRYKDKGIYDINKLIFGRIIGTVFNALLVLYLFAAAVAGSSLFNIFIRITLLKETPAWVLAPFIILPSFYLVWQGLKNVSRFMLCSAISYIVIILFVFFLYKDIRISFLMPVGEAGITNILKSTKTCFSALLGFESIAFFYQYISDKNRVLKWSIGANFTSMVFFLVIVSVSTAVFGENLLRVLLVPFFNLFRVYNAPILERLDLYLVALWFIPTACSIRTYIFAAFDGMQKVFRLKKSKIAYTLFIFAIIILSIIPEDINQVFALAKVIRTVGMFVVGFMLLCLILSFIRKKGVTAN